MRTASTLREEIDAWEGISQRITDALELAELDDKSLQSELETEVEQIETTVSRLDFEAILSGEHDQNNAIFSLHAGAGGVDAQDFAEMLLRMYLRWNERRGYNVDILDRSDSDVAGIKSATLLVNGRYAYGYLKAERGVHRLVRLSPFDSAKRRHTSFVLAEVHPEIEDTSEVEINPSDLQIDTFRASSAGGQHVQKNETAIRITHLTSGIVVQCQNERSQAQNRENAMKVLRSRLYEIQLAERQQKIDELRGDYVKAEWGSQIRSYVLHPYQMVKDHRTNLENNNTSAVLDGDLDGFMEACLRANI